jgi:hypothetical protein
VGEEEVVVVVVGEEEEEEEEEVVVVVLGVGMENHQLKRWRCSKLLLYCSLQLYILHCFQAKPKTDPKIMY